MEYVRTKNGYFVRLNRGEQILKTLQDFAEKEQINSASLAAIGAVSDVTLGYFDPEKREYLKKSFDGIFELVSLQGNLAFPEDAPFWHLHAVIAGRSYQTFAGHLFDARVAVTLEAQIFTTDVRIPRVPDRETGLKLLDLKNTHRQRND